MKLDLTGYKIALDCANGAVSHIAPDLFREYGATVVAIGVEPNGLNINKDCGSTHLSHLCGLVVKEQCDIGFAFDGDADRMLAVDSTGRVIDGDVIMAIIALDMKARNQLHDDTLVVTVMSNLGLDIFARQNGITLAKTKVGDRYVLEEMVEHGYQLGGEQSGHVILLGHQTTGDGLLTSLRLLQTMTDSKKSIDELASVMHVLPQVLKGAKVRNECKSLVLDDFELKAACSEMENKLDGKGRILIRASGTEPLIRVMLEGEDLEQITQMCQILIGIINRKFAV
jgi:phosphoglucosamine mutase